MRKADSLEDAADAELAKRVMAMAPGEARAEESELCRRFAPRVRLYGLRHLRSEHSAADLVQRVLVITLEKLRGKALREPDRIASFVLGTARMSAREIARAGTRLDPLGPEHADLPAPARDETLGFEGSALLRCLDELGERERAVIMLTFFQELSAREVARDLATTEGNARVLRHRAVERLRGCLGLGETES
jgi:RNA polymerase sigma-70 factor (ECF subfamily)